MVGACQRILADVGAGVLDDVGVLGVPVLLDERAFEVVGELLYRADAGTFLDGLSAFFADNFRRYLLISFDLCFIHVGLRLSLLQTKKHDHISKRFFRLLFAFGFILFSGRPGWSSRQASWAASKPAGRAGDRQATDPPARKIAGPPARRPRRPRRRPCPAARWASKTACV